MSSLKVVLSNGSALEVTVDISTIFDQPCQRSGSEFSSYDAETWHTGSPRYPSLSRAIHEIVRWVPDFGPKNTIFRRYLGIG